MGRSGASCFKIMACGGDRAERDEVELPEVKCPGDKRRWSFQRRSARHQVPDDIVISEPVSVTASKMESPETSKTNFHLPINSYSPEKITVAKCLEESPPLSPVLVDSKSLDSLSASNDTNKINYLQESAVVVIQTAVRGYLAKRELRKCKNVVKLQAAVRGHLVRRQAIGTLRCVQAIIKMQTLVRAHYMRNNSETLTNKEELLTDTAKFSSVATGNFGANQNKYSSTEKLLKNGFARMLLKSTPRTKPIYISSDRLRSDSAWRWLERWMALTSTKDEKEEHNLNPECHKQGGDGNKIDNSEVSCESLASASYAISKSDPFKSEGFSKESTDSSSNPVGTSTLTPDELSISVMKEPSVDNSALVVADDTAHPSSDLTREAPDSDSGKTAAQLDATSQPCSKHVIDIEKSKRTTKRMICDSLEAGAAKSVGLVESCSPAFSAAKSKFEELIEAQTESTSSDHEVSNEVKSGDFHLQVDSSGFGTKIFLFSGVDLADRKTEDEIVLDTNPLKKNDDAGGLHDDTYDACNLEDNNSQHEVASEAARALKLEGIEENPSDLVSTLNSVQNGQPFAEPTDSASAVEPQADRSSPETSPRSHRTVPESLGTPSSQISVNVRSRKTDRKSSNKNPKSKLLKKKLPTTTNNDSDARMSTQNGKTNPVGKNNLDDVDPGTRVSSGTSLPSYMQPTESAKAKFHASNSPKSGPDVHDKDTNTRKRHSLPAENGKQESSPRMLRSTSLVQHSLKGNTSHSPHNSAEKKWQR